MRATPEYEIAVRYREIYETIFSRNAEQTARDLGISRRTLDRYFLLAEIDPIFLAALGGPAAAKTAHAVAISRAAKTVFRFELMKEKARQVASRQSELRRAGRPALKPSQVVSQLVTHAAGPRKRKRAPQVREIRSPQGITIGSCQLSSDRTPTTIRVLQNTKASISEIKDALFDVVDQHFAQRA